jgi:arabinan endo-1,5-alpha-L-arabinosidase
MDRRRFVRTLACGSAGVAVTGAWPAWAQSSSDPPSSEPLNDRMSGDFAPVHDPCIIKSANTYHLFCTTSQPNASGFIACRTSNDLASWKLQGTVFKQIPSWARKAVPGTKGLWAPDISRVGNEYRLYYSCSTFGSNRSVIGLATNETLDSASPRYAWQDRGLVIESQRGDDFNAIDPNFIVDREGGHWLALGSFWSGIKLFPLDPGTGKPAAGDARKFSLAARPVPDQAPAAIEAPFLIDRGGYYYLFVSFDYCCQGRSSSYYIVVGRSKAIAGPYVGRDGKLMTDGYGTMLLRGNRRFRGPGHNAFLHDAGKDYLVYHAYDQSHDGRPVLRISPVTWSADGWPQVSL